MGAASWPEPSWQRSWPEPLGDRSLWRPEPFSRSLLGGRLLGRAFWRSLLAGALLAASPGRFTRAAARSPTVRDWSEMVPSALRSGRGRRCRPSPAWAGSPRPAGTPELADDLFTALGERVQDAGRDGEVALGNLAQLLGAELWRAARPGRWAARRAAPRGALASLKRATACSQVRRSGSARCRGSRRNGPGPARSSPAALTELVQHGGGLGDCVVERVLGHAGSPVYF